MSNRASPQITPALLLHAYSVGVFPMAESAEATEILWYDPPIRALIPLDENFHIPHRLARTVRQKNFRVTVDTAFEQTMRACAAPAPGRETTWINEEIIRLYCALHRMGNAHSIEVWSEDNLVGGLYGVSLGSAFFGESMFSRKTDASKIALVHLVSVLRACGYMLLDTQFQTPHLEKFGTFEITRSAYHLLLKAAIEKQAQGFASGNRI